MPDRHTCTKEPEFRVLHSDVEVLKELFGYKDKRNGEFREAVEKEQDTIINRLTKVETTMQSSNQWLKINAAMMALMFAIMSGILMKLLL
jgi:hypothetical protein